MTLGATAMPPQAYVAFCERQPLDCGSDAGQVIAAAARADADRAALSALMSPHQLAAAAVSAPAAISEPDPHLTKASWAWPTELLAPAAEPLEAVVRRADIVTSVAFVDPATEAHAAQEAGPPAMTPELWSKLNRINDRVNRAILERTDLDTYGTTDYWTTPLEDGQRYGDCEDFVLEKQRALIAAGVPRRALNIALVTTSRGEGHAVLLVSTRAGDFVLDNMSAWVTPWRQAPYRWRQRQVNGDAFAWAMIEDPTRAPAPAAAEPAMAKPKDLLIASLR
ncbi:hypothetical protein DJ021_13670 [Phenylobacterium hankyongense]|uniref:Transglutaminase n=1 Tax=Phenylobacterium hankyongense TaxID=1813876 RepID=A0A328B1K1_9CAUL|nr:transglutaminase-like cysteine peptidase [Phenylobacterium hankyongense]RAK60779.1 hypothetical protein DJ021_13670 [Phenylobacterium hankyongense]